MSAWVEPASTIAGVWIDMGELWAAIVGRRGGRPRGSKNRRPAPALGLRAAILDQLDRYAPYLRRLRRSDPEAYDLYRQVGATLMQFDEIRLDALDRGWAAGARPSFGCVFTPFGRDGDDTIYVKFHYFQKLDRATNVEPHRGDLYRVTLYWDDRTATKVMKKTGFATQYYVDVLPDGQVRALRSLQTIEASYFSRARYGTTMTNSGNVKGLKTAAGRSSVSTTAYAYSPFINEKYFPHVGSTAPEIMCSLFISSVNMHAASETSRWRVLAEKGDIAASFRIPERSSAAFFADREIVLNERGNRRRVFHRVSEHARTYADGHVVTIAEHFRGQRQFAWNGYAVSIAIEGATAPALATFEEPAHELETNDDRGFVEALELGARVRDRLVDGRLM